jgi:hypothetical protein
MNPSTATTAGTGPQAQALVRAAHESFVDGWQHSMWAGAAVMAVLFVYVLARGPQPPITADLQTDDETPTSDPAVP